MATRVDYVVSISLEGHSGKSKATAEKAKLLRRKSSCRVYSIPDTSSMTLPRKLFVHWLLEATYLVRIATGPKPDVIVSRSLLGFGTRMAQALFRVPVVREVHADFLDEAHILYRKRPFMLGLAQLYQRYLLGLYRSSAGLIFNHPDLRDYFIATYAIGEANSIFAYNGCNTSDFTPKDATRARQSLGLPLGDHLLVFVGSVSRWHGVQSLLETFSHLTARRDDVRLIVVGGVDPAYMDELRASCASVPRISFVGPVPTSVAAEYVNAASVCLLPVEKIRISPGSPIKLFDYISCGKPVIAQADTRGYSDLVEAYELGIACDFHDAPAAADRIDAFLDGFDAARYSKNNRKVAETALSWEQVLDAWMRFLERVVDDKSPGSVDAAVQVPLSGRRSVAEGNGGPATMTAS